jgi:hypothetical protein
VYTPCSFQFSVSANGEVGFVMYLIVEGENRLASAGLRNKLLLAICNLCGVLQGAFGY